MRRGNLVLRDIGDCRAGTIERDSYFGMVAKRKEEDPWKDRVVGKP